ncbi:MAG: cytidine deaminase [Peptococcaceae bacterium]|nr:cytidine deaminase [Peptococcaceae bacterium]MDH7524546.1 cytidine deaminase [Peptococcaceae bacterium]
MDYGKLVQAAQEARERAYAPYSGFKVGAALLGFDGRVFTGCNVENASYGLTLCAERSALARAVGEGVYSFQAIAVVTGLEEPAAPCGACRQALAEFSPEMTVVLANNKGTTKVTSLKELLPLAFGKPDLGEGRHCE